MKRLLLTGATGFIGRAILAALVQEDCQIRVTVRPGKEHLLPKSPKVQPVIVPDLFHMTEADADALMQDMECIIHAAWYTKHSDCLQSLKNLDSLMGSLQLARSFQQQHGKRFVGIGSFFEYDMRVTHLAVTTPVRATHLYSACKIALFTALESYFKTCNVSFAWLRLFSLYGESPESGEQAERLVPYIHKQLANGEPAVLTGGSQVRDYLEVHEAAAQIVKAVLGNYEGPVNICSGKGITVRELAERIAAIYGRPDLLHFGAKPPRPGDAPYIVGEVSVLP